MLRILVAVCAMAVLVGCKTWPSEPKGERHGYVTLRGQEITLIGPALEAGQPAPAFTAVANDMSTYTFAPASGKVTIIAAVPSLDTPVCSAETKKFNDEAAALGNEVQVLTISMDLPFAQKRWCGAEGVKNLTTLSDSRDRSFGKTYGVLMKQNGLLARSVFVVGKDGKLKYVQLVPEVTKEPDYAPVIAAAKAAK